MAARQPSVPDALGPLAVQHNQSNMDQMGSLTVTELQELDQAIQETGNVMVEVLKETLVRTPDAIVGPDTDAESYFGAPSHSQPTAKPCSVMKVVCQKVVRVEKTPRLPYPHNPPDEDHIVYRGMPYESIHDVAKDKKLTVTIAAPYFPPAEAWCPYPPQALSYKRHEPDAAPSYKTITPVERERPVYDNEPEHMKLQAIAAKKAREEKSLGDKQANFFDSSNAQQREAQHSKKRREYDQRMAAGPQLGMPPQQIA
eukprot:GHVU01034051.1.p1 GENE.GHVU01034051.1~~GHVU01034051.1.p1  ORF type:complete len:256 (+),score=39.20 GHVU01034051.1:2076-2843(+)